MFRIAMEIDGKPVDPENFADELMRAAYRSIEQGIVDQVSELRCPVHGDAADVTLKGSVETDDLRMTFKTCCEDFERTVLDAVGAVPSGEQGGVIDVGAWCIPAGQEKAIAAHTQLPEQSHTPCTNPDKLTAR